HNIVTLTSLTNSFVSCCLENPVDANDYYGVLLKRYQDRMYIDDHSLWPYLMASTILKEVERLCIGNARPHMWKFRFIIALLIRRSFGKLPGLKDDTAQRSYATKVIAECRNRTALLKRILGAEQVLADAIIAEGASFDRRNAHQDRRFIDK